MISVLFVLSLTITMTMVSGQNFNYGINPKLNFATQLTSDPSCKSDGTGRFNSLTTWGLDGFIEKPLLTRLSTMIKAGYCQEGFTYPMQISESDNNYSNLNLKDKFNYLHLDLLGKVHLNKKNINPYAQLGIRTNYLINKKLDDYIELPMSMYNDYSKYKNFNIATVGAIGIEIRNTIWVDVETSIDVLRPVRTSNLAVRNSLLTFNLGMNINKFIKS